MSWINKFIGIPFYDGGRDYKGVDCWGIPYLAYRDILKINIGSYSHKYKTCFDQKEIEALINNEDRSWWIKLSADEKPKEFDVILFRLLGRICHCGVYYKNDLFIHCMARSMTTVEKLSSIMWKNRVEGIYRHVKRI